MVAHAGAGASWQAMVVLAGLLLTVVLLGAAIGRITIDRGDDLVVPIAVAAVISSLAPFGGELLSDAIGWGLPLLVVVLTALVLAAFTPLDIRFPAPLPMGAIALASISGVLLYPTLTAALHPPAETLPLSDGGTVTITAPADGSSVDPGITSVAVEAHGASIGPGGVPVQELPDDPEQAGDLAVALTELRADGTKEQQQRLDVAYDRTCSVAEPCREVAFGLDLEPGSYEVTVELTRGDGVPLAPSVRDRVAFTVDAS